MMRAQFHLVIKLESIEEFKAHYNYSIGIFCHALAIVNKSLVKLNCIYFNRSCTN